MAGLLPQASHGAYLRQTTKGVTPMQWFQTYWGWQFGMAWYNIQRLLTETIPSVVVSLQAIRGL